MINEISHLFNEIQKSVDSLTLHEFAFSTDDRKLHHDKVSELISQKCKNIDSSIKERIEHEFYAHGPLEILFKDDSITEILVNGSDKIWFEKHGKLFQHSDKFLSDITYRNCIERICSVTKQQVTVNCPNMDSNYLDFRISMIGNELTQSGVHISLRRHPKNPWTLEKLSDANWCRENDLALFNEMLNSRKNFLVIGSTGSGKTSILNSLLQALPENERVVCIEDTSELTLSNSASMKLLTRHDANNLLPEIDQAQLVKRALRLRPDRIVMGEIRGNEAKDFLMALATGHTGSFGTLHAKDAHQALIRLEMLIQAGAPQWNLTAVRRLIQLSLDYILITEKNPLGQRVFKGLFKISSLEEHGFLLEPVLSR